MLFWAIFWTGISGMIWYFVDEKSFMETLGMEKEAGEEGTAGADASAWVTAPLYLVLQFKFQK